MGALLFGMSAVHKVCLEGACFGIMLTFAGI